MKKVIVEQASPTMIMNGFTGNSEIELNFKVLVLGDSMVGKTSIIDSFITEEPCVQPPTPPFQQTRSKQVVMRDSSSITVNLFDLESR